jgi:acyl-CoA reductase-like NAD-dependent aldehyde dehydrogenase
MTMQLTRAGERTDARLFIGGEWVDGPAHLEVRNPAHPDEIVGTIVRGTPADVDRAVAAAKAAQPAWAALGFRARAEAIGRGLDRLNEGVHERSVIYVRENGKTLEEAGHELKGLADRLRLSLEHVEELDHMRSIDSPTGRTLIAYRPYGVIVSIVPWNSPVTLAFNQIVSGLLAGNSVVVKPPESAPLALIASIEAFARELAPGLVNIITGLPDEIGDALTTHPDVGKIGFTGSIRAAKHIGSNAAQTIKSVTLELGGNDAAILLEDVDLSDATMDRMAASVFYMTGQVCMAIKRIYVPEKIAEAFIAAFRKAANKLVIGDGLDPKVTMGPMHTKLQLERGRAFVDDAVNRGATVEPVGTIADPELFDTGYFMQPSIVTNIAADAPLVVEEQFCPSVPIVTYRDLDDVLARANDTVYGLGGSIWSRDIEKALELATRVASGSVWINAHGTAFINRRAPYGGVKQSGIGRKAGLEGILDYLQLQTISSYEKAG